MRAEYLLFDLFVLFGPLLAMACFPRFRLRHPGRALVAIVVGALPFVLWDLAVTGRHWNFNPAYSFPPRGGLPLEEWGFFLAVPFACLFTWEHLGRARAPFAFASQPSPKVTTSGALALVSSVPTFASGYEYAGLVLAALGFVALTDAALAPKLLLRTDFWRFQALVAGFTLLFDGYLTWRPVVIYEERYLLGMRIGTIPLEDFGYGAALIYAVTLTYEALLSPAGVRWTSRWFSLTGWFGRSIEARLGGYRQVWVQPNDALPRITTSAPRVCVIGGGLSGLTTASILAERGFRVDLLEASEHLGGKVGAKPKTMSDGSTSYVDHGFHAFFGQYYNLDRWLRSVGVDVGAFRSSEDYLIIGAKGERHSYGRLDLPPVINLVALWRRGVFGLRHALSPRTATRLMGMLTYDPSTVHARYDAISYDTFANEARLPPSLRLAFGTFARAFFSPSDRMSMAEVMKSFHFYFLSHAHGLGYAYPQADYQTSLVAPIVETLARRGVRVRTGAPVDILDRGEGSRIRVRDDAYDHVVLATTVGSAREILSRSRDLVPEGSALHHSLASLETSRGYGVLRLYTDHPGLPALPPFFITERKRALDAVAQCHLVDPRARAFAEARGGSVLELHCYSVPEDANDERRLRAALLADIFESFPELENLRVLDEDLELRRDFPSLRPGLAQGRPATRTDVAGLVLAGDWVRLPTPAMLMEAACTSGLLAANAILEAHGLSPERVETVPNLGLFASRSAPTSRERSVRATPAPVSAGIACVLLALGSLALPARADRLPLTDRSASLSVRVNGLRSSQGNVLAALYRDATGFPGAPEHAIKLARAQVQNGGAEVHFGPLAPGRYAVALFHDENQNGALDKGWLGIPKEGVGTSGAPRSRLGPPRFDDAAFTLDAPGQSLLVHVVYP